MLLGDSALVGFSAIGAFTLVQYEMGDIEFDFWQFKHLVRVEWCSVMKPGATAVASFLGLAILGCESAKTSADALCGRAAPQASCSRLYSFFLGLLAVFILVWVVGKRRLAGVG